MRRFVNPGNAAFEVAVNSQIYVDKNRSFGIHKQCDQYKTGFDLQQQAKEVW